MRSLLGNFLLLIPRPTHLNLTFDSYTAMVTDVVFLFRQLEKLKSLCRDNSDDDFVCQFIVLKDRLYF